MEVKSEPIEQSREVEIGPSLLGRTWIRGGSDALRTGTVHFPPRRTRPRPNPTPTRNAERKVAVATYQTVIDELFDLSKRAKRGDREAEARVVQLLDMHPGIWLWETRAEERENGRKGKNPGSVRRYRSSALLCYATLPSAAPSSPNQLQRFSVRSTLSSCVNASTSSGVNQSTSCVQSLAWICFSPWVISRHRMSWCS